jgi:hypothetical protein
MFAVFQAFDETEYPDGIVISPDGRALAWHRSRELWVRRIDELEPRLIYTGGVNSVCWSPDGRELAFAGERAAWRISAEGGRPARVADMQWGGLSWQESDRLIVSEAKSIWSMSLTGEEREVHFESGEPDAPDHWHFAHVLPDGAGLIGLLHRASEPFDRIEHFRGDEKPRTIIQLEDGELAGASLAADGTLAYTVEVDGEWSIWSARLSLEGPAGPTLLDVPRLRVEGARHFSLSASGTLAYLLSDDDDGDIQMGWLSLAGGRRSDGHRPAAQAVETGAVVSRP